MILSARILFTAIRQRFWSHLGHHYTEQPVPAVVARVRSRQKPVRTAFVAFPDGWLKASLLTSGLAMLTFDAVAQTAVIEAFRNPPPPPAPIRSTPLSNSGSDPHNGVSTLGAEVLTGHASGGTDEGNGLALRYSHALDLQSHAIEYRRQSRFNETGQQVAAQLTRPLNRLQRFTVGSNISDSFLFARFGLTGVFEQTWPDARFGATRVGLSWQRLRDSQEQTTLLLEHTARTANGWVFQLGRQQGVADPGDRTFYSTHAVVQYLGGPGWRLTARRQWSREAFQALSATESRLNFSSQQLRLTAGVAIDNRTWVNLFHDRYDTPFYERRQTGMGLERSW